MQLGKLLVIQLHPMVSSKTCACGHQLHQWVTIKTQNRPVPFSQKATEKSKLNFSEGCRGRATANAPVPLNSNSFSEESATHSGFHENIARARDPTVRTPARIREPAGANKKPPSLSNFTTDTALAD